MEGRLNEKQHWDDVYEKKTPDQVSWYRPHLERLLLLDVGTGVGSPRGSSG
jgi:hypothetical protein